MSAVPALPSATITLVRDAHEGIEVLMLQRNFQSGFVPGMHLFPGGAVDEGDAAPAVLARCVGMDDAAACATLELCAGGLAHWTAAIRESFEEAGVLLAYDDTGTIVNPGRADKLERFEDYRRRLNAGEPVLQSMLEKEGLRLAADRLIYFSHWITPLNAPRRYDTRFFIAAAPAGQEALPDLVETIHHTWVRPSMAIDRYRAGDFKMRTPTISTLQKFAAFDRVDTLIAALRAQTSIPAILPRIGASGKRLLPGQPGYEEAATAEGQGEWK
jgi:8-oxo-dGTP pyrophosphatase MutT (NUDIX family)